MLLELVTGLHSELAERLAEVVVDSAGTDEQLRGDFLVRSSVSREVGDLCFLRCQVVECLDGPFARVLAGGLELDPGALGERFHAELGEQLVGGAQLLARVEPAALAAQPLAVKQTRARARCGRASGPAAQLLRGRGPRRRHPRSPALGTGPRPPRP